MIKPKSKRSPRVFWFMFLGKICCWVSFWKSFSWTVHDLNKILEHKPGHSQFLSGLFLFGWYHFLRISPVCRTLRFQSLKRMNHLLVELFFLVTLVGGRAQTPQKKVPFRASNSCFSWNVEFSDFIHPGRLTWNTIMEVWKIMFLSKWVICRFHVNLPGCMLQAGRTYVFFYFIYLFLQIHLVIYIKISSWVFHIYIIYM